MKRSTREILIFIAQVIGLYTVCYTLFYIWLFGGGSISNDVWCSTPNAANFDVKVIDQHLTPVQNPTADIRVESPNCHD